MQVWCSSYARFKDFYYKLRSILFQNNLGKYFWVVSLLVNVHSVCWMSLNPSKNISLWGDPVLGKLLASCLQLYQYSTPSQLHVIFVSLSLTLNIFSKLIVLLLLNLKMFELSWRYQSNLRNIFIEVMIQLNLLKILEIFWVKQPFPQFRMVT